MHRLGRAISNSETLFAATCVSKSYATPVLSDVAFDLKAGEVHALVGENGAGKSTLARIIAGLTEPDSGRMLLRGALYAPESKVAAAESGVRIVLQELNLIANLSIAENIYFDQLPHRFGWVDYARLHDRARQVLAQVGLEKIDPARKVGSLGVGQQQLVEIAAGISRRCDVLILDEPTAALTGAQVECLFTQTRRFVAKGGAVLYISHRMEEIRQIADRITVLRDGKIIATRRAQEVSTDQIVALMVGRDLAAEIPGIPRSPGPVLLRVQNLRAPPAVRDVSFEVHAGEILGFAGLMGSGRTETMRALFGADRRESGSIFRRDVPVEVKSPTDAVRHGIALLTEDRKGQGLLLPLSVRVNTTLLRLGKFSSRAGWIKERSEVAEARRWVEMLKVRCASVEQPVGELSGGNQQKVVLAKWLLRDCEVLVCDEPTRGIDVGAKFEIYQLLVRLADKGKAIVIVSSDLKELLETCDRIVVMSAGRVAATFRRGEWTQEKIMTAALSGYQKESNP